MTNKELVHWEKQKEIYNSLTEEQLNIINEYCTHDLQKLKKLCSRKICSACGDSNMDEDDLYSIAMDVLIYSIRRYDDSQGKFETFLSSNIQNKINTYIRDTKYRAKRSNVQKDENGKNIYVPNISIDASTDEGIDIVEKIDSGFQIEDELSEKIGFSLENNIHNFSPVMQEYLHNLSRVQIKVLELMNQGYNREEIQNILHITKELYKDSVTAITSKKATRKIEKSLRGYKNVR